MNKSNLNALLKKLYCKNQKSIFVFNAPREFLSVLWDIGQEIKVIRTVKDSEKINFALVFTRAVNDVEKHVTLLKKHMVDDTIVWFAYPKKSSKTYRSKLPSDYDWESLKEIDYEIISMISIDNDWTAIRFKKSKKRP